MNIGADSCLTFIIQSTALGYERAQILENNNPGLCCFQKTTTTNDPFIRYKGNQEDTSEYLGL